MNSNSSFLSNLANYYIQLFGYIQFSGFIFTPLLGLMFLGEELCGSGERVKSPEERKLKEIKGCILPASVTVVLGTIFCILPLLESTLVVVRLTVTLAIFRRLVVTLKCFICKKELVLRTLFWK